MLAQFLKAPGERKKYTVDYSQWLSDGEQIASVVFGVTRQDGVSNLMPTALVVDGSSIAGLTYVLFYVSGGVANVDYEVLVTMTTTQGQIKQDMIVYNVQGMQSL